MTEGSPMPLARISAIAAAVAIVVTGVLPASAQSLTPGTYEVLPHRSASLLTIKGPLGSISAEIPMRSGSITVGGGGQITASRAVLDTGAVSASNGLAERQIRSPTGLDVDRYPTGQFIATGATVSGPDITLRGNLTIKSTTRPITLTGEIVRANDRRFSAVFEGTIDRTKFGVTAGRPLYGRNASVRLRMVARKPR
ncbi:MAG: YceI family protein [Pseudomonadota bacterium]